MSETNHEDIARRVRALLAKTVDNGCTEAEALAAAAAARRIMDQHRLSQSDIQIEAEPISDVLVEARNEQKMAAVDYCLGGIDHYCGVKTWFSWKSGKRHIRILGLSDDTAMATYLYQMLARAIDSESQSYVRTIRERCYDATVTRRHRQSFMVGMALRVCNRLTDMAKEQDAVAKTSTGTALVVVKGAKVAEAFDALHLKFSRGSRGISARSADAYRAGREAGDRVNLSRPVTGQGQGRLAG